MVEKPYSKCLCTSNQGHNKHKPVRNRVVQYALVSTALIQFTSIKSSLSSMTFYKRNSKLSNLIIQVFCIKNVLKSPEVRSEWLWLTTSIANSYFLVLLNVQFCSFQWNIISNNNGILLLCREKVKLSSSELWSRTSEEKDARLMASQSGLKGLFWTFSCWFTSQNKVCNLMVVCLFDNFVALELHLTKFEALCVSRSSLCSKEISI